MSKNRKIFGTPQNQSDQVMDEIRRIFDKTHYMRESIVQTEELTSGKFYTIHLPPDDQFLGFDTTDALAAFCQKHQCKWWVGAHNVVGDSMWVRVGYLPKP